MEKVLLGMSGGVDSSVAAVILKEQGYDTAGVTLSLCGENNDCLDAEKVCERLSISHFTVDLKNEFKEKVIDYFINEYIEGKTPNPCLACNKHIKFGLMLEKAKELGFDKIATGHYVRIERSENGRYLLKKARDVNKDQSYVLYMLSQEQLASTVFPLGELTKENIREIAKEKELINANRPDSQDICFVPDGDYASYIENYTGEKAKKGSFVNFNGEALGSHSGIIRYTIGQRKGLGIALGRPQFVIEKDPVTNNVILGDEDKLFYKRVYIENLNFIPFDKLEGELRVKAKLRYRHTEQPSVIYPYKNGVIAEFDTPQRAPSAGQAAVFYDGDTVVGGGIIKKGLMKNE